MEKSGKVLHNTVIHSIGKSHAVWFQQSGSYVLLEEAALEVFKLFLTGAPIDKITNDCIMKYGHLEKNMAGFVDEIVHSIQFFNNPSNKKRRSGRALKFLQVEKGIDIPGKVYRIGEKCLAIAYGNEYLQGLLHPLIAHLETEEIVPEENFLELLEQKGRFFFRYRQKFSESFGSKNVHYFTGALHQQLYSILYDRDYNDWMAALHASGVVKKGKAVLFSAAGGSGKSTISAILGGHGYQLLSDDFIMADRKGQVYSFPAAISVKEGSIEVLSPFYHGMEERSITETIAGKTTRYIPVDEVAYSETGFPVGAFVFVKYKAKGPFLLNEVDKREALQLLLKETWVNQTPEMVARFFEWIDNTRFYRLHYSQISEALEATAKILAL